ncbi:hypothetical protein FKM82_016795 [Ascaphus truei]
MTLKSGATKMGYDRLTSKQVRNRQNPLVLERLTDIPTLVSTACLLPDSHCSVRRQHLSGGVHSLNQHEHPQTLMDSQSSTSDLFFALTYTFVDLEV